MLLDGAFGGVCDGAGNSSCSQDKNAVCSGNFCVCKPGFTGIEGSCTQSKC
ncbi:hypothetical protein DPMN_114661 [Dreissena polymorpha]|uniref:EB domain-containing protein n=1 Tax=Dreissena polymorpha TaxID=45954 RepID=A0A9D4KKI1_DREPO|nr:hypothetical protein DPMN_114661 [Dreissena polymorpha]